MTNWSTAKETFYSHTQKHTHTLMYIIGTAVPHWWGGTSALQPLNIAEFGSLSGAKEIKRNTMERKNYEIIIKHLLNCRLHDENLATHKRSTRLLKEEGSGSKGGRVDA